MFISSNDPNFSLYPQNPWVNPQKSNCMVNSSHFFNMCYMSNCMLNSFPFSLFRGLTKGNWENNENSQVLWNTKKLRAIWSSLLFYLTVSAFSNKWKTGPCIPTSSSKGTSSTSSAPSNICSTCASRRAACCSRRAATFSAFLLIS